jgi:hypothetical protein
VCDSALLTNIAGSLELKTSGKFPDECSKLVSKIKHKFFSEENLYGLWNLEIRKKTKNFM